jgi:aspartate carbamoyltransferase catalytic subunit
MKWHKKHLLGIADLSKQEIELIFDQAKGFKEVLARPIPKVPALRGTTIAMLFCEPSTRTRSSFELAAKRIGADTMNMSVSSSSFVKGETLKDTVRNIEAMRVETIVIRHSCAGSPHMLAQWCNASIVNAGDGFHEHPTQALLDTFTIKEKLGKVEGLNVSLVGDIAHSRVALSNILALNKLGAKVTLCAPKTLIPPQIEKLGVKVTYDIKDALHKADVVNVLRIQLERQTDAFFPTIREYVQNFGINKTLLKKYAKKNVVIMHPGPINREVELANDVADGEHNVILQQVTNGVAIRMAVLYLLKQE